MVAIVDGGGCWSQFLTGGDGRLLTGGGGGGGVCWSRLLTGPPVNNRGAPWPPGGPKQPLGSLMPWAGPALLPPEVDHHLSGLVDVQPQVILFGPLYKVVYQCPVLTLLSTSYTAESSENLCR